MTLQSILVIDDSYDTRDLVSRILEDAGYEVRLAGCAKEAFEELIKDSFDLVVCDLHMPVTLDHDIVQFQYSYEVGLRTIRELRSILPDLPIVVISATAEWELPELLKEFTELPALSKPFSARDLLAATSRSLRYRSDLALADC